MAHSTHKIVGPMLRAQATPEQVLEALSNSLGLRAAQCVVEEWVNEAKRRNGKPSSSALIGRKFRAEADLRSYRRPMPVPHHKQVRKLSRLQRLARHITRMFRKH